MKIKTSAVKSTLESKLKIVMYFILSIAWKNQSGNIMCPGTSKNVIKRMAWFSLKYGIASVSENNTAKETSINKMRAHKTLEKISDTLSTSSLFLATSRVAV